MFPISTCGKSISKMPIFVNTMTKNQRCCQRFVINFLLTQKLVIDVNEKVVGQITTFQMSGQQALNSMSMGDYAYFCSQIQKSVKNVTVGPVPLKKCKIQGFRANIQTSSKPR